MYSEQKHLTISTYRTAPPQTYTHQKKMDPDYLYFDPHSQGDRRTGGSEFCWYLAAFAQLADLPLWSSGFSWKGLGRSDAPTTTVGLEPTRTTSHQGTKTKRQTPASTKTEDGQQPRRDDPDGSHRQFFNPSCEVGGIRPEVTLPPIGRVACRWPAPRRGSVVVSGLLASHWLEHLGFARSSSIGWRKHSLPFGAEPRSEAMEAPPTPSAKNTWIMESVREGLVGWQNEVGCC